MMNEIDTQATHRWYTNLHVCALNRTFKPGVSINGNNIYAPCPGTHRHDLTVHYIRE